MLKLLTHLHTDSLRFKLPLVLFIIIIPFILLLIYISIYAVEVVKDQVTQSNKNMVKLYLDQIDAKLAEVDNYILTMESLDTDLYQLNSRDDQVYYLSHIGLLNKISKDVKSYPAINSIFAYSSDRDDLIDAYNNQLDIDEREKLRAYIRELLNSRKTHNQGYINDQWFSKKLGNNHYLFRVFNTGGVYFGAWINVNKLTMPLKFVHLGENGRSMFVNADGEPMLSSNDLQHIRIKLDDELNRNEFLFNNEHYLISGERSTIGEFSLVALIPEEHILANLPLFQRLVLIISVGSIFLIPLSLLLVRNTVIKPMNRILNVMKKTRDNNILFKIPPVNESREFRELNDVFNEMMTQIEYLKINVYEEQLNKQKAELKHMQLQLNPHFLMNSLNMIYSLALVKKHEIIQEMSICLVEYFRFMLKSNSTFVTLKEELIHVENYLRIQELRFKRSLTYTIEVVDLLKNFEVPPLLIQTFVENTVKHAVTLEKPIHIQICISIPESERSVIQFDIKDNGPGFPTIILETFENEEIYKDKHGVEHIGIWNLQKRLKLIYGEDSQMVLSNNPQGGASIQIKIPLKSEI